MHTCTYTCIHICIYVYRSISNYSGRPLSNVGKCGPYGRPSQAFFPFLWPLSFARNIKAMHRFQIRRPVVGPNRHWESAWNQAGQGRHRGGGPAREERSGRGHGYFLQLPRSEPPQAGCTEELWEFWQHSAYTSVYRSIHICTHTYIYIHVDTHRYVCISVCMHICMSRHTGFLP